MDTSKSAAISAIKLAISESREDENLLKEEMGLDIGPKTIELFESVL